MPVLGTTKFLGNRNLKNTLLRRAVAIAAVLAVHLAGMGLVIGVANAAGFGQTSGVSVSVDGTTGWWTPATAAAPVTTPGPTTAPPVPEPPVTTAPDAVETSTAVSSVVGTPSAQEPTSTGEPVPTTSP